MFAKHQPITIRFWTNIWVSGQLLMHRSFPGWSSVNAQCVDEDVFPLKNHKIRKQVYSFAAVLIDIFAMSDQIITAVLISNCAILN